MPARIFSSHIQVCLFLLRFQTVFHASLSQVPDSAGFVVDDLKNPRIALFGSKVN